MLWIRNKEAIEEVIAIVAVLSTPCYGFVRARVDNSVLPVHGFQLHVMDSQVKDVIPYTPKSIAFQLHVMDSPRYVIERVAPRYDSFNSMLWIRIT